MKLSRKSLQLGRAVIPVSVLLLYQNCSPVGKMSPATLPSSQTVIVTTTTSSTSTTSLNSTSTTSTSSTSTSSSTVTSSTSSSTTSTLLAANQIFVLSPGERTLFTPPSDWDVPGEWTGWEGPPLKALWEAFNQGRNPTPLDPNAGPSSWYEPEHFSSQNHALLWLGASAIGHGLAGNVAQFDNAAQKALTVLELDRTQGHMRQESVGGYVVFWEGGIATMALAARYAPPGSAYGAQLLTAARNWWANHIAVLRKLRFDDGQVALLGARIVGENGGPNDWAHVQEVNLQLFDPIPHASLHPVVARKLTPTNAPRADQFYWQRPRHVATTWVVLRAIQSGALGPLPQNHPVPSLLQAFYRWKQGTRTYIAIPQVMGLGQIRWKVSWAPGEEAKVEVTAPKDDPNYDGRGPHLPPTPLNIPANAEKIL